MNPHILVTSLLLTLAGLFGLAGQLWASGFGVFTQGARGLGQANAVVAHSSGPESLYFNPALLPQLGGTQVEAGTTLLDFDQQFSPASPTGRGQDAGTNHLPSTLYLTRQISDRLATGVGVFFPFGLSSDWGDAWDGRYISTKAELTTVAVNPVLAWRPLPQLSLAAGLSLVRLDAELQRKIDSTALGFALNPPAGLGVLSDINQRFEGDGWGEGYNLALLLQPDGPVSFGAHYRSSIEVKVDGSADFTLPADTRAVGMAVLFPDTSGSTKLKLPAQATFGLAWQISDDLVLEAGSRWEQWSSFDELRIDLATPILGSSSDVTPRRWDDTWSWNLGGEWQVSKSLALQAGYLYSQSPVPDATFEPSIPDAPSHLLTVGGSFEFGRTTVSLAYGYQHFEDRTKTNTLGDPLDPAGLNPASTANGRYETDIQLLGVSVAYAF